MTSELRLIRLHREIAAAERVLRDLQRRKEREPVLRESYYRLKASLARRRAQLAALRAQAAAAAARVIDPGPGEPGPPPA